MKYYSDLTTPSAPRFARRILPSSARRGFAQKIRGGHRPPLQLGVRNCRGALRAPAMYFLCKAPLRGGECFQERSVDDMKMSCFLIVAAGLILLGTPGFAHHGTGVSYDAS